MQKSKSLRALLLGTAVVLLPGCRDASRPLTAPEGQRSGARVPREKSYYDTNEGRDDVRIVSATGDITAAVTEYRGLLGGANNVGAEGEQAEGHREINWDAAIVPTNTDDFPGNFFNVNSKRGALFTTDGSGFRVSDNGYVDVNPNYDGEFNFFSPKKLFVAVGSTITDVQFVVAGSNTQAVVTGFGSVFADVGRANSTTIEYFDVNGNRLLKIAAPRASDATGLSFLGAVFDSPVVARVRITSGDTPIGATAEDNVKGAGQKFDIVAMDDFLYGEPRAVKVAN